MKIPDAAKLIDISERRFRELIGGDVITRASRGAYEPATFVPEYCRHLRKRASGRPSLDGDARKRLDAARADLAELELAEKNRELIPLNLIEEHLTKMFATIRQKFLSLPTKTAPMLHAKKTVHRVQKYLEKEIHEILQELANYEPNKKN